MPGRDDLKPTAMKTGDTMSAPAGNDLEVARLLAYGQRGAGPRRRNATLGHSPARNDYDQAKHPGGAASTGGPVRGQRRGRLRSHPGPFSRLGDGKW